MLFLTYAHVKLGLFENISKRVTAVWHCSYHDIVAEKNRAWEQHESTVKITILVLMFAV